MTTYANSATLEKLQVINRTLTWLSASCVSLDLTASDGADKRGMLVDVIEYASIVANDMIRMQTGGVKTCTQCQCNQPSSTMPTDAVVLQTITQSNQPSTTMPTDAGFSQTITQCNQVSSTMPTDIGMDEVFTATNTKVKKPRAKRVKAVGEVGSDGKPIDKQGKRGRPAAPKNSNGVASEAGSVNPKRRTKKAKLSDKSLVCEEEVELMAGGATDPIERVEEGQEIIDGGKVEVPVETDDVVQENELDTVSDEDAKTIEYNRLRNSSIKDLFGPAKGCEVIYSDDSETD
jgi:hypothetical protein